MKTFTDWPQTVDFGGASDRLVILDMMKPEHYEPKYEYDKAMDGRLAKAERIVKRALFRMKQ